MYYITKPLLADISTHDLDPRIVNGEDAGPNEFLYQVPKLILHARKPKTQSSNKRN